ncbi:MAG TPA: hypothetical protein VEJ63_03140 [Planctomycetota bacterium]|nr:hypothetical protein [Planctomycetota bacterium]
MPEPDLNPRTESIPCSACGQPMPIERKELLGVTTCIKCTKQKKKPIGAWDYPENFHERVDGVGGLVVIDPE